MSKVILGPSGALTHDPSAALYIDAKLIAAAEEERFARDKHAKIDLERPDRWHYAKCYWYALDRAFTSLFNGNRRGEPMVCAPQDALNMFYGSDLPNLVMEDIQVKKA